MGRTTILILSAVVLLAACGPKTRTVYEKPGSTQAEYDRANFECQRNSRVVFQGTPLPQAGSTLGAGGGLLAGMAEGLEQSNARRRISTDSELYELCMKAAGYTPTRATTPR